MNLRAKTDTFDRGMRGSVKSTQTLNRAVKGLAVSFGAIFGARAIIKGARGLLTAWSVQEEAVEGLRAALAVTGRDGAGALERITKRASELQQVTTQGDEAIIAATASFALLAQSLDADELARSQEALIGIADTFFKGDVQAAALIVGKSIGSTTNALTRYGIQVDVNATQSEKLNQILQQSHAFFEVSKRRSETLAGAAKQLSAVVGDLKEAFGRLIEQRTGLTEFLQAATSLIGDFITIMGGTAPQLEQAFKDLGIIAGNAFSVGLVTALQALPEMMRNFLKDLPTIVKILPPVALYRAQVEAIRLLWRTLFSGLAEEAKANITGAIIDIDELAESIRKAGETAAGTGAGAGAGRGLQGVITKMGEVQRAVDQTQTAFSGLFKGLLTEGLSSFQEFASRIVDIWLEAQAQMLASKLFALILPAAAGAATGGAPTASAAAPVGATAGVVSGAGIVLNQTINLNLAAVDGQSAAAFLRTQKGTIAELMGEAAQESPGFARMIRGR